MQPGNQGFSLQFFVSLNMIRIGGEEWCNTRGGMWSSMVCCVVIACMLWNVCVTCRCRCPKCEVCVRGMRAYARVSGDVVERVRLCVSVCLCVHVCACGSAPFMRVCVPV